MQINSFYSSPHTTLKTSGNGLPGFFLDKTYMTKLPFAEGAVFTNTDRQESIDYFEKAIKKRTVEAKPMEIDLIRYRDEIGLFIDGICYLHQPTNPDPARNIDLNIQETGSKMAIEKFEIWRLRD